MLKPITREEATEIVGEEARKGNSVNNVVICNGVNGVWYDIRGMSMERVGAELTKIIENSPVNTDKK